MAWMLNWKPDIMRYCVCTNACAHMCLCANVCKAATYAIQLTECPLCTYYEVSVIMQ